MKITIKNARLSFPDLFQPRAYEDGGVAKFKGTFLVPKGSAMDKEIDAAIAKVAAEKWGAKADAILKTIRNNPNRYCYQDGETKTYDGYEGMMAFSASNKVRPTVIDRNREPLVESDGRPYAGCFVNAVIEIFTYENPGKGISASLSGVQFVKDGEAFSGGRPASVNDFEDLGVEEEEDALA
jgi:hypothetical protein